MEKKIILDSKVYKLEVIYNACYAFIDRAYIFLDNGPKAGNVTVLFRAKQKLSSKGLDALEGDFINELLHCALRCSVSANNKKIREYIVGRALYSALPVSDFDEMVGVEKLDYQEDPLGIAVPWEKKNNEKKNSRVKV